MIQKEQQNIIHEAKATH